MDYFQKYKKYKAKYLNLLGQNMSGGGDKTKPTIYLFKMTGCYYCQQFEPIWEKLQENSKINDQINFETYDVKVPEGNDFISQFETKYKKIQGYPTIILEIGDKKEEYKNKRDEDMMVDWILSKI